MCKKCTLLSFSNSPSLKTLLMCLVITERYLWNNDEICACVSHTVSFSTRTSSRMVSSGWYITISPLLSDSMLCILSNLEFNILVGDKGNNNPWHNKIYSPKSSLFILFPTNQSPFRPFVANNENEACRDASLVLYFSSLGNRSMTCPSDHSNWNFIADCNWK